MASQQERMRNLKAAIKKLDAKDVTTLAIDLCGLSSDAMDFAEARLGEGNEGLQSFKERIETALYPDPERRQTLEIGEARRAISEYSKAVGDEVGLLELMIHYVECGTEFTANVGDINAKFYDSMLTMYERFLKKLEKSSPAIKESFRERAYGVVSLAGYTGWGYQEGLLDLYDQAFPDEDTHLES